MSPSVLRLALISAVFPSFVAAAGITSVLCNATALDWSFNKEGDTPCQVAANLGAVCSSTGDYTIPSLAPPVSDNFYTPSLKPTPCECSSVIYSLAGACGMCQGGIVSTWTFWTTNCTAISPGTFPFPIPPNTFVPHWAFVDPTTTNNKFDAGNAQLVGDAPESTPAAPAPTSAANGGVPSSAPSSPFPTSGSSNSPPSSGSNKSSTNAGAIAGGVVGGVIGLGLLGGLLFYFMRRSANNNNNRSVPVANGATNYGGGGDMQQTTPYENKPYNMPTSPYPDASSQYTQPTMPSQQRPYDPNDPSTFPGSPNSFGTSVPQSMHQDQYSTHTPPPMVQPGYGANQSQHGSTMTPLGARPGGYSGVAEI